MTLPLIIEPDAEADIEAARTWDEQHRPGLGDAFIAAVDECLRRIQAMPGIYPIVARNARRTMVRPYSYFVLYRVEAARIVVLAVMHTSRDPRTWQSRI